MSASYEWMSVLIKFTISQHGSVLRNPRKVCSVMTSLHVEAIVLKSCVVWVENIPVPRVKTRLAVDRVKPWLTHIVFP